MASGWKRVRLRMLEDRLLAAAEGRPLPPLPSIAVEVARMSGDTLLFEAEASTDVALVKQKVFDAWGIPPSCQQLAIGTTSLAESAKLAAFCSSPKADETVRIMLVVAMGPLVEELRSANASVQLVALHFIAQAGSSVNETLHECHASVIKDAVSRCLQRGSKDVRVAMVGLAPRIILDGDLVETMLINCLQYGRQQVRIALLDAMSANLDRRLCSVVLKQCCHLLQGPVRSKALKVLAEVAGIDDEETINVVCAGLADEVSAEVRAAAVSSLAKVASPGHAYALQLVMCLLDHSNSHVRIAAATAMHDILGDSIASISVLTLRLLSSSAKVRASAVDALTYAVPKGSQSAARAVLRCIKQDVSPEQLQSVLQALARVARPGDAQIVKALLLYTGCEHDCRVRHTSLKSLGLVAQRGDQQVTQRAQALLHDADESIRRAASLLISSIGKAEDMVFVQLWHQDPGRRRSAVESLGARAREGDVDAIAALAPLLSDQTAEVRQSAFETLVKARCSRHKALDGLSNALEQDKDGSREPLLRLLAEHSGSTTFNAQLIGVVCACLEDSAQGVRHLAIQVLADVGKRGDHAVALDNVSTRLDHQEEDVRAAAVQALLRLAPTGEAYAYAKAKLAALMKHSCTATRFASVETFVRLCYQTESNVNAVLPLLTSDVADVRSSVFMALRQIPGPLQPADAVLDAAKKSLKDSNVKVRHEAMRIVSKLTLVAPGDKELAVSLCACLEDKDAAMHNEAVHLLKRLALRGDQHAIMAIRRQEDHPDDSVRRAASEILARLTQSLDDSSRSRRSTLPPVGKTRTV